MPDMVNMTHMPILATAASQVKQPPKRARPMAISMNTIMIWKRLKGR